MKKVYDALKVLAAKKRTSVETTPFESADVGGLFFEGSTGCLVVINTALDQYQQCLTIAVAIWCAKHRETALPNERVPYQAERVAQRLVRYVQHQTQQSQRVA